MAPNTGAPLTSKGSFKHTGRPAQESYVAVVVFTRRQLIDRDYNPLEDPAGPDRADLEKRYAAAERPIPLDHAAAVRGILVSEGINACKWI